MYLTLSILFNVKFLTHTWTIPNTFSHLDYSKRFLRQ